jgi:uncharacterized RDD family membrane protein YckC
MTTFQPPQDPCPELDSPPFGPPLCVPPPQFGRSSPTTLVREPARSQVPEAGASSRISQPEPLKPQTPPGSEALADFGARVISFLVDCAVPVVVLNLLLSLGALTGPAAWYLVLAVLGCLGLVGFGVWNSGYLQGTTGRSLGRRLARTKLVTIETGQPLGFGRALRRQLCHGLEFGIGYLWPLWDSQRQTFADKIVGAVVIRTDVSSRVVR